MSNLQHALTDQVIAAATTTEVLETAQTLLRAAFDKTRDDTTSARGDGSDLSDDELLDQVLATQRVQNSAWATQTLRLEQLAQREFDKHPESPDTWTPLEVGARLGWTDRQTSLRLTQAVESVRYTPQLLHHAGTGELESRKVVAVSDALADAIPATDTPGAPDSVEAPESPEAPDCPADLAAIVEAEILASDPEASTSTKLRRRAQRLLVQHAPVASDQASAARRRDCTNVTVEPHWEPGMSMLTAVLPSLDAAKLMAAVNAHARLLHDSTTASKSLGECRVDALTDMLLSNAQVTTELVLHVPFHPDTAPSTNTCPGTGTGVGGPEAASRHGATGTDDTTGTGDATSTSDANSTGTGGGVGVLDRSSLIDDAAAAGAAPGVVGAWMSKVRPPGPPKVILPVNRRVVDLGGYRPIGAAERQLQAMLYEAALGTGTRPPPDPAPPAGPVRTTDLTDTRRAGDRASLPHRLPAPTVDPVRYRLGDVQVPGVGVIPATVIRELTRLLGVKLTRALVDAETGIVAETSCHSYTPGAGLARFVRARDQHCRFPGCTRPAKLTDLDHVTPYPDGPTAPHNLQCLCRHHHRAKHEAGWTVYMTTDGTCTWASPTGHTYTTRPAD
ncbi:HNH endonuclease [Flexivirga sp. ID2601S]|uniref:HNH endonuclease n=1 Tax=Flexivirga aerilata TaxID=1656889 RepID=A0A849AJQ5_9MICO|nr:HNH endonuclease signature motif containing protein [Flexivirga aerilata]NNG40599.1 HNH endonuclease [Flexivirga aerilata]